MHREADGASVCYVIDVCSEEDHASGGSSWVERHIAETSHREHRAKVVCQQRCESSRCIGIIGLEYRTVRDAVDALDAGEDGSNF